MTSYDNDQASLRTLRLIVEEARSCIYLEIGSEAGRSLVPALLDPRCTEVHSVDSRPVHTPDERGFDVKYGVSTSQMVEALKSSLPPSCISKLITYDISTWDFAKLYSVHPNFVFLDAEHTNTAVFQDFLNIWQLIQSDAIFAFHDSNLIFDALTNITALLTASGASFCSTYLADTVFALAFGDFINPVAALPCLESGPFIARARQALYDEITMNAPLRSRL